MPFPNLFGLPEGTPKEVLRKMRAELITAVAEAMDVSPKIVRPFFVKDLLGDPDAEQDNTIYCRLDTGMFFDTPDAFEAREKVTRAVAQIIWDTFDGEFEVEVFIGDLDGRGKTLLKPRW
ncbi:MAG: hypothetical protein AAB443_01435 [Patescibacteria group bacterium]